MLGGGSALDFFPNSLEELRSWHPKKVADWAKRCHGFDDDDAQVITDKKISGAALLSDLMTVEKLISAGLLDGPAIVLLGAVGALKHPVRVPPPEGIPPEGGVSVYIEATCYLTLCYFSTGVSPGGGAASVSAEGPGKFGSTRRVLSHAGSSDAL